MALPVTTCLDACTVVAELSTTLWPKTRWHNARADVDSEGETALGTPAGETIGVVVITDDAGRVV